MRKNTQEVFQAWIAGKDNRKQSSIWTNGSSIYSYGTIIFQGGSRPILNATKYSPTTSRHQNGLRLMLDQHGIQHEEVQGVWIGSDHI